MCGAVSPWMGGGGKLWVVAPQPCGRPVARPICICAVHQEREAAEIDLQDTMQASWRPLA